MRRCKGCKTDKPLAQFSGGQRRTCNDCRAAQERRRRARIARGGRVKERAGEAERRKRPGHQAMRRRATLKHKYGLTVEQFDELFERQGGLCALCRKRKAIVVDHDHETDAVRGLLCRSCNSALGVLGDSAVSLERVIGYLRGRLRAPPR